MEETSAQVVDSMFDLNVLGTLRLTRAVLPYLISRASPKHERRIVVVGSMVRDMQPCTVLCMLGPYVKGKM